MTDEDFMERALRWRDVEDPCQTCNGSGTRLYGSGSTWRGGMGTTCMATDVCDACWGTGDRYRSGVNLRQLRDEERTRIAKAALTAVVDSCAASLPRASQNGTGELLIELDKLLDRRRSPMSIFAQATLCGLRNLIARALGVQERKL